jgi:hypothetical protein
MKRTTWPVLLTAVLSLAVFSCEKDDDKPSTVCLAGPGGDIKMAVFAVHNGDTLMNDEDHPDTAFVKYSATSFPGVNRNSYDTYFVGEGGEDHIHIKGLKCGKYVIYRTAYSAADSTRYQGFLSIDITKTSGEIDTAIVVN